MLVVPKLNVGAVLDEAGAVCPRVNGDAVDAVVVVCPKVEAEFPADAPNVNGEDPIACPELREPSPDVDTDCPKFTGAVVVVRFGNVPNVMLLGLNADWLDATGAAEVLISELAALAATVPRLPNTVADGWEVLPIAPKVNPPIPETLLTVDC